MSEPQKIRRFNKPLRYPAVIKTDKFSKSGAAANYVKKNSDSTSCVSPIFSMFTFCQIKLDRLGISGSGFIAL